MFRRSPFIRSVLALALVAGFAASSFAQTATAADIAKLDSAVAAVTQQVATMRKIDPTLAAESAKTLAEIQEDLTYLKVKQRKENNVTPKDVKDLADRIETLRVRTQSSTIKAQPMLDDDHVERVVTVPVGTEMDVRLQTPLSSRTAKVEQRFEATTLVDVVINNETIVPAGTLVRGFVSSVRPAGRIDRRGSLTLSFDEMVINGSRPPMRASLVQAMEGKMGEDAGRITAGAAVGAILGGIIGGGKGALAGIVIGGGGTVAATDGADAELAVGTILRIRLDQPLEVTVKK
jgi:hypothetical protein